MTLHSRKISKKRVTLIKKTKYVPGVASPSLAEAVGIKEALSWVKTQQQIRVEVESDNLVSIQAIRGSSTMYSVFGLAIQDRRKLMESLSNVYLHFVKRSANRAAHVLARHARDYADCIFREGNAPTELSDILVDDLKFC